MSAKWPRVRLGEVLVERRETPSEDDLFSGNVRIVEKIGFNEGRIQLRVGSETKTGMILIRPGDLVVSGINAAKGAIAVYGKTNKEPVAATIHYGAYIAKALSEYIGPHADGDAFEIKRSVLPNDRMLDRRRSRDFANRQETLDRRMFACRLSASRLSTNGAASSFSSASKRTLSEKTPSVSEHTNRVGGTLTPIHHKGFRELLRE